MFLPRHVPPMGPWWVVVACLAWLAAVMLWHFSQASRPQRLGFATAAGVLAVSLCPYSCGGYGNPPGSPTLSSIGLNPTSVAGGSSPTGTVTPSRPAPSGGAVAYPPTSASPAARTARAKVPPA